jgi:hypothetical protein
MNKMLPHELQGVRKQQQGQEQGGDDKEPDQPIPGGNY